MNYYEANYPYYALLKASNKNEAITLYNLTIGELIDEEEMIEVSRDYALAMFTSGRTEEGKIIGIYEIILEFNCDNKKVLLIDSALS
ncbi:hypothetical protein [Bacillus sp. B-jedd]|uniref:hypothetical protein n=1 Tax=Bacillus sp. B-jedd TaxID=1476857 RepID=UPI0005155E3E|nr:hypothetical protein [Bacillus sp. B-jedd]CEG29820.1 hypothetical protein BN1002_04781 [Bacillus sp. B-jedd]